MLRLRLGYEAKLIEKSCGMVCGMKRVLMGYMTLGSWRLWYVSSMQTHHWLTFQQQRSAAILFVVFLIECCKMLQDSLFKSWQCVTRNHSESSRLRAIASRGVFVHSLTRILIKWWTMPPCILRHRTFRMRDATAIPLSPAHGDRSKQAIINMSIS